MMLLAGALSTPLPAAELRLLDLREARVRESVQPQAADGSGRPLRLSVEAGLAQHDLVLSPNLSLGTWSRSFGPRATAFEGELPGLPGSWARLTRTETGWVGMWSDGVRHFALDIAGHLSGMHPLADQRPAGQPMVYALADAVLPGPVFAGDTVRPALSGEQLLDGIAAGAEPATAAATLPTRRLSLALVADAELAGLDGTSTETNLLARLNVVDGIFASQVGVRIAAGSTTVLSSGSQPFTSTDPATLLQQLRQYRIGNAVQQAAGLSHLMTGRNLDERTIGIAYIGGLCSDRFGASLSEARSGISFDALIAAHEIGHVFGAPHDGEDACVSTPQDRLMATQINGSTTFSACSLEQMAPVIERATCLAPIDAADVSLGAPLSAQVALGQATPLPLTIRSEGNVAVQAVELQVEPARNGGMGVSATIDGGGSCVNEGTVVRCLLGTLSPGTQRGVQLTLLATVAMSQRLTLRLAAANDALPGNNSSTVDLQVVEGADLAVTIAADPARVEAGGTTAATVQVRNLGLSAAPRSAILLTLPAGITAVGATSATLTCAVGSPLVRCDPVDLAVGDAITATFTLRGDVAGQGALVASATSARFDPQPGNSEATVQLTVTALPNAPSASGPGGGGGGGSGAALLFALALLAAWRQALRQRALEAK
jgi:hypothetical protein